MPALDQGRGWCAFRAIEDDTQGIAIDADDSEITMWPWRVRQAYGF